MKKIVFLENKNPVLVHSNLYTRFLKLAETAHTIYIVSAWAGVSDALDFLIQGKDCAQKIHAVIGLWGNATDPKALTRMHDCDRFELLLHDSKKIYFHPKVYIFEHNEDAVVWIGSPNFTKGGFKRNYEVIHEFRATSKAAKELFGQLKIGANASSTTAIEAYKQRRRKQGTKPSSDLVHDDVDASERIMNSPVSIIEDWKDYVTRIEKKHKALSEQSAFKWGVFTTQRRPESYQQTIEVIRRIVRRGNWVNLTPQQGGMILGLPTGNDLDPGLFGSYGASALGKDLFIRNDTQEKKHNRQRIRDALTPLDRLITPAQSDEDFAIIESTLSTILSIHGVGIATATRILTLFRPDMFVCVNEGSVTGLSVLSGFEASELQHPSGRGYIALLKWLFAQDWYRQHHPSPMKGKRAIIWRYRAALLDVLAYHRISNL
jgi:HKD family nuclease